jgi:mRNA-degrading endonuclease RelE of RelBE toxin-antitoxin system
MRLLFLAAAREDYLRLEPRLRQRTDKQLRLLLQNLRHPSLRAKKYDARRDIWQGRITASWRFYFRIERDAYVVLAIVPHPK